MKETPEPGTAEGAHNDARSRKGPVSEVFRAALKLGLTSFGGPIAHLGYFRDEYVTRRKWMDDQSYVDVVSFSQSLPGAASSKVGIVIGTYRAGLRGGLAAWLGFTMPSTLILILFGYTVQFFSVTNPGWLHGLKIAAVVIVAQAVIGMWRNLSPDAERTSITIGSAITALALQALAVGQVIIILTAGLIGWLLLKKTSNVQLSRTPVAESIPRWLSFLSLAVFFGLLVGLPIVQFAYPNHTLAMFDSFYRSGSLVFGGGHVVLPLLNTAIVSPGWVASSQFLAGYGMTQAMPGPLFTFSVYLGTVMNQPPNGIVGGLFALFAIFLPSFLLVYGALPFWDTLRTKGSFQSALRGINAAVVGILVAALYSPIFTSSVNSIADFGLLLVTGTLLLIWKRPPWNIVLVAAVGGFLIGLL